MDSDLPNHCPTGGESIRALDLGRERYTNREFPFYADNLNFCDVVEVRGCRVPITYTWKQ